MNIIYQTKWALLELFPDQAATEKDAEEAARQKIIADAIAKAEEEAKAAAEAAQKELEKAAEAAGETPEEPAAAPKEETGEDDSSVSAIDKAAAELDAIELVPADKETDEEAVPHEELPPPVSILPEEEGPRPNGILVRDYAASGVHVDVQCSPDQVVEAANILNDAGLYLESISGVDWIKEEEMEVVYDYNLTEEEFCRVVVRTRVPRSEPKVPTISSIHPGANWHERETHEFFGIKFQGHPYLVPLLLPEDADFHPLLKDFKP